MVDKIVEFPDDNQIEQEACRWVLQFDKADPPAPEQVEALRAWVAKSPRHKAALLRYAHMWENMEILPELLLFSPPKSKPQRPRSVQRTFFLPLQFLMLILLRLSHTRLSWGVSFAALVVVTTLTYMHYGTLDDATPNNYVLATQVGQTVEHRLPDGSTIWLNTNSRVQVDFQDQVRRLLVLNGEAHFKVVKDTTRPFEVLSGDRLVRAVGTAFTVRRIKDKVKVYVVEGKVELATLDKPQPPSAKPAKPAVINTGSNQKSQASPPAEVREKVAEKRLGYLSAGESVLLAEVHPEARLSVEKHPEEELSRTLAWRKGLLIFAGEPLSMVVKEVERYTNLRIDISEEILGEIRIGGQFHLGETDALFDVLERGFGLTVSRIDDKHVVIEGNSSLD